MAVDVDLSPRTSGLLPLWLVAGVGLTWLVVTTGLWRRRSCFAAELAALGALFLSWVAFFWRPLLSAAQVPRGGGDLNSFFFPLHAFAARVVQQGEIPYWNPTLFSGLPHWANYQAGLLYPPNWILYLLARPFSYGALELLVLAQYLVASSGAYALARLGLRLPRIASLVAGIVFPYSGFLVAHLGHYSMLAAAVWIPWLWLGLARSVVTSRWRWSLLTASATFLLCTGGHQQTVLYGLSASALWWLACFVRWRAGELLAIAARHRAAEPVEVWQRAGRLLADAARSGLPVASGVLAAAPALLPSLDLARRSVRAGGLGYEQASEFSLQPIALVNFWWGPWASGEVWAYAGVVTFFLASLALALSREPLRWALAGIGLIALLHALGPATPLHGWVYRFVPFADLLRAPARSLLFVDLVLALLSALGLAAALEPGVVSPSLHRRWERRLLLVLAALTLFAAPLFLDAIVSGSSPPERAVLALEGTLMLVLWLGLATLWFRGLRTRWPAPLLGLAGVLLVVLDLFSATAPFNPTPDDLLVDFRHAETVAFLRQASRDEPWRFLSLTIRWQPSAAAVYGLEDAGGLFDPMQPASMARALECVRAQPALPLLDLLNVRFILTRPESGPLAPHWEDRLHTSTGLVIWENRSALPRAWLRGRAEVASVDEALDRVCRPDFDPQQDLLLAEPLPPADPGASGTVRTRWDGPNRLLLDVQTSGPAYLVVAITADPGWRAALDGRSTAVVTADGLYQAIWVPAGQHRVEFRYRPPYLEWGIAGVAAGVLLLTLFPLLHRLSRIRVARTAAASLSSPADEP
jgi:hypothetical protein